MRNYRFLGNLIASDAGIEHGENNHEDPQSHRTAD
jgi:hypothetical protein